MLALAIIALHVISGIISYFFYAYLWEEGLVEIMEIIYQLCILYFCWRYSTRPRLEPKFEEEEAQRNLLTEEVMEEEAYPSVQTEEVMEEEIDYESIH